MVQIQLTYSVFGQTETVEWGNLTDQRITWGE